MKQLILLFLLVGTLSVYSQDRITGKDLVNNKKLEYLNTNSKFGTIQKSKDENGNIQFLVETTEKPKFIFNCASAIPIHKQALEKGRVVLLRFTAKTVKYSLETGEAKVNLLFRQSDSYKNNIVSTQSISSNWQTYYIPFQSDIDIQKEHLAIVLHFGFSPQAFQIKDIKFELFPVGTSLEALPKTKIIYDGMEPEAIWRKKAITRIEQIRKGNFQLKILKNGEPIANKSLSIKQKNHSFPFGGAISAKEIVEKPEHYKNFKKAFNHVVLANDLKIKAWRWKQKIPTTLKALEILKNDGYKTKGHVLIWPGFNYLTPEIKENKEDPEAVTQIINNHLNTILDATKGKIALWDVVNEAYTNQDLQTITGSEEILYDGFRTLKVKQPKVLGFTNEYGIISKGGLDTNKQQWYYDFIKRIDKNTNGLIDGIGIQCHIGSDLTPPEKVIKLLAFYASLNKRISISEFTMDITDNEVREQYTRDFLIAAFSHPSVSEFLFWGYVEDERKKVDIYKKDWTLGAMGKAYFSLAHEEWKSNLVGTTDDNGNVSGRGFFGEYEYSFVEDGKLVTGTFNLKTNQLNNIKIEL